MNEAEVQRIEQNGLCGCGRTGNHYIREHDLYDLPIGETDHEKRATRDKAYQEQLMAELLPEEIWNIPMLV